MTIPPVFEALWAPFEPVVLAFPPLVTPVGGSPAVVAWLPDSSLYPELDEEEQATAAVAAVSSAKPAM